MRLGYFGGTFDPPHAAHLQVARAAADAFRLRRVLLAPTGRQPLKSTGAEASFADRMAMVKLLCSADPRLQPSDLDAPRDDGEPNFTVDALERLKALHAGDEIFSIVGADSFLSLRQWKAPDRLLELAQWIVVSRPEHDLSGVEDLGLSTEQRARVHLLTTVDEDTSATGIRERLHLGISPGDRLTTEVLLYISRLRMYHPDRQS